MVVRISTGLAYSIKAVEITELRLELYLKWIIITMIEHPTKSDCQWMFVETGVHDPPAPEGRLTASPGHYN